MDDYSFERHTPPRKHLSLKKLGVGMASFAGVMSLLNQFGLIDLAKDIALDTARNALISLIGEELQKDSSQLRDDVDQNTEVNQGNNNTGIGNINTDIEETQINQGGDQVIKGGNQTANSTGGHQLLTGGNQSNNQTGGTIQVHSPSLAEKTSYPQVIYAPQNLDPQQSQNVVSVVDPQAYYKSTVPPDYSFDSNSAGNKNQNLTVEYPHSSSNTSNTFIPSDVEAMWVFYQDRNIQEPNGCSREGEAQSISPESFMAMKDEFIDKARSTNRSLVITAYAPVRSSNPWDSAAREITINNKLLNPMTSYWCNGKHDYGYEYPI